MILFGRLIVFDIVGGAIKNGSSLGLTLNSSKKGEESTFCCFPHCMWLIEEPCLALVLVPLLGVCLTGLVLRAEMSSSHTRVAGDQ